MFPQLVKIQNIILIRNLPCLIPILHDIFPFLFISSRDGTGAPVPAAAGVVLRVDAGAGTGVFTAKMSVIVAVVAATSGSERG